MAALELPFISVVIATYQRSDLLVETITDVLAQDYSRFEVIVVDQSEEPVDGLDASISVIHTRPPHLPRARNVGLLAAKGDVVVFVDDDVAVPPRFLTMHAKCYADPRVGGVAGRVILNRDPSRPLTAPPATGLDFDRDESGDVPFARGCNMSFRKSELLAVGLFDERFSVSEEEDVCFALRRRGLRLIFSPEAWLVHRQAEHGGTRPGSSPVMDRPVFYHDKMYFALKNVGGLDFWRIVWDTYRHALPPRARGKQVWRRQVAWSHGTLAAIAEFARYGVRHDPLPYRRSAL
ncbi:MAG: glycosyltransferase family 2 protein [Chloroflexi bacterium]|nr:glycosyltransferase family 2 protein [Chloroflexota bacterium]